MTQPHPRPDVLVREHVSHKLSDEDAERMLRHIKREAPLRQRRKTWGRVLAVAANVALLCAIFWFWQRDRVSQAPPQPDRMLAQPIALPDGSRVLPLEPSTRVRLAHATEQEVHIRLEQGHARFDVQKRPNRLFVVVAEQVEVVVRGTRFDVERTSQGDVAVNVLEGHVTVNTPEGSTDLYKGQSWRLKTQEPEPEAEPMRFDIDQTPDLTQAAAPRQKTRPVARADWRKLARQGRYKQAARHLAKRDVSSYEDVMLAAETMRMLKRHREAERYMAAFVRDHPNDRRADAMQLTRAKLVMKQLHRPAKAAAMFKALRKRLPASSPLQEDIAAREVEATARSGDHATAHALAKRYMRLYPGAARAQSVKRWGKLP